MDNREAIDILNDVIRQLNKEYHHEQRPTSCDMADKLNEVRQFLGKDL